MTMDRLDDIEAFLAVVEKGSLTAAARHLGRSLQSISRSLSTLERSVAVDLVRRTMRQSHPTEAGLAFYRRVKPALTEIGDARREAASQQAELAGLLRVGGPVLFAAAHIVPVIAELVARHPRLEIELKSSDREVDLVAERLDIAVRIREMRDSTLKARRLGCRSIQRRALSLCARYASSPSLLQGRRLRPSVDLDRRRDPSSGRMPNTKSWRVRSW